MARRQALQRLEPNEWIAAMRAGNFARAWEISDRDLAAVRGAGLPKYEGPRHLQRIWRGEPLHGRRVLVRCYHGLGDTILFARFLAPLRTIAREVILWCQSELFCLMSAVEGVDRILPLHDGDPDVDFDVDVEIMEIPHAIRAARERMEMRSPYLRTFWRDCPEDAERGGRLSIGLVWDVGEGQRWRVIAPQLLKQFNLLGVKLYSLQRGAAAEAAIEMGAIDISTPHISVLARRLQRLDLCICPDTMVAHLSGALGCETWIMLHANCDWRWPASGHETFWYPTVRLFRQRMAGDWREVMGEVRSAILEKIANRPSGNEHSQRAAGNSAVAVEPIG